MIATKNLDCCPNDNDVLEDVLEKEHLLSSQVSHEIPLTVGVVGSVLSAALFPVVAAVGAIGAMVAHLTIVIEKRE